jgi:choline transport protein
MTSPCWCLAAQFVSAATVVGLSGSYQTQQWKTYLTFSAILIFTTLSNIFGNKILGRWNDGACMYTTSLRFPNSYANILLSGFVSSCGQCYYPCRPHRRTAANLRHKFSNGTQWSNGGAWILGLLQSALSLIRFDAATYMAEEMPQLSRDVPRAMLHAIGVGGVT